MRLEIHDLPTHSTAQQENQKGQLIKGALAGEGADSSWT